MNENIYDETIREAHRKQHRRITKDKVEQEAFQCYRKIKEKSKKNMRDLKYTKLAIQPYMKKSYGRHQHSQPMRIGGKVQKTLQSAKTAKKC